MPTFTTNSVGTVANDGTGTSWRTAWTNVNATINGLTTHTNDAANPHVVTEVQLGVLHRTTVVLTGPASGDERTFLHVGRAVVITEMRAVHAGTLLGPSVTWTVRHDPDRGATGNEVVTGGTTTTSATTGDDVTSFNDETVPADSFLWLELTAESGTTDEFVVSVTYKAV